LHTIGNCIAKPSPACANLGQACQADRPRDVSAHKASKTQVLPINIVSIKTPQH